MIFTALKELAEREGLLENSAYEEKRVAYLIKLGSQGKFLGIIPTKTNDGDGSQLNKPQAKFFSIPLRSNRAANDWAEFMVDKGEYVFGWPKDESEEKVMRARRRQTLFINLAREACEGTKHDEGVDAVLNFLDHVRDGKETIKKPEDWVAGDLFGFVYDPDIDTLVSSRPAVAAYWATIRNFRVQMKETKVISQCIVTGKVGAVVALHPKVQGIPPISNTKGGVPLTSTNKEAFSSYELDDFGGAGVSFHAADAYGKALEFLLADKKHHVKLSSDTVVVFWSRTASPFVDLFVKAIDEGNPETVARLYESPKQGLPSSLDDKSAFYALTLSGARGRGTVRTWFESTVCDVAQNIRKHFEDLNIQHDSTGEARPLPLWRILLSTAPQRKNDAITPVLASELFRAILNGSSYPRLLLDSLVRRARAEKEKMPWERAATIKAYLNRAFRVGKNHQMKKEVDKMLDKGNTATAYRLGRLFSVLERIQEQAVHAGSTIRDRYWGAASSTPVVVFPQLFRKVPHHIAKLGHAPYYEKLIQEIVEPLPSNCAFPSTLTLEEQGLFALGYYQQRQDLFTKHKSEEASEKKEDNHE